MGRSIRTNLQALVVQDDWAPNTKVNVQKQRSAFPPNFVHSLDSTHMLLTAKACSENGMWRAFAVVGYSLNMGVYVSSLLLNTCSSQYGIFVVMGYGQPWVYEFQHYVKYLWFLTVCYLLAHQVLYTRPWCGGATGTAYLAVVCEAR